MCCLIYVNIKIFLDFILFINGHIINRYLTTLYSHPDWPSCSTSIVSEELKQNIKQHPDTVAMNIPSYVQSARAKTEYGGSWSFTDIFGHMIGDTIIKGVSILSIAYVIIKH